MIASITLSRKDVNRFSWEIFLLCCLDKWVAGSSISAECSNRELLSSGVLPDGKQQLVKGGKQKMTANYLNSNGALLDKLGSIPG